MRITVANVKGGVGKTTSAVYLAAVAAAATAEADRPVLLVDADPQGSAAEWLDEQPVHGVRVVEAPSERLLARAVEHDGPVVLDTPPGAERLVRAAIAAADVVLIPTRVGGIEPARAQATLGMLPERTPAGLILVAARAGTRDLRDTRAAWRDSGIPLWATVPERVGIAAGPDRAALDPDGLDEYRQIWQQAATAGSRRGE